MFLKEPRFRVSPGTWVYWDVRNSAMKELGFKIAGVVLGQVIDRDPEMDTVTLDVGSKAASPDLAIPDRFKVVGHEQAGVVSQSEEHGVVKLNGERMDVGDLVLCAPGHACTTSHLFPDALVVNSDGDVVGKYTHQARDRG
jgi:D-serine deaminase-like pyridoxal phosphate-dependent protein